MKSIISFLLVLLTLAIYYRLAGYDFVNFDDDLYVTANSRVLRGLTLENFMWAFSSIEIGNWHPLTWLSHMTDIQVHGLNPGAHHLTNLIFHVANTVLVLIIFSRMTGHFWQSVCLAALFALHPLHVESVAWVAERKDVISTFFLLLTIWCYSRYVRHSERTSYLAMLLFFILGLLSKPMVVTLPFILLLLDYWPLKRFQFGKISATTQSYADIVTRTLGKPDSNQLQALSTTNSVLSRRSTRCLIREKIPLIVLSVISCAVTFFAQYSSGTVRSLEVMPLAARVANALIAYVTYIIQMVFPMRLAVFYPYAANIQWWNAAGAFGLLVSASYFACKAANKHPYILFGWLWYLGTLLPVIGIVQVGAQAMADRYTYVPLIGLFVLIIWGVFDFAQNRRYAKVALSGGAVVIVSVVSILTWVQIGYWKHSIALFEHALEVTTDNYLAHNNLANALTILGENDQAMSHYTAALQIYPNYADAHYNKARMLTDQNQIAEAIWHYRKALKINPRLKEAHFGLGLMMAFNDNVAEAVRHFSHALQLDNTYAEAHNNLGVMQMRRNRIKEAIWHFQTAVRLKPGYETAKRNLAVSINADTLN